MDINGSVVLVTGASSGIGAATARAASHAGARVVLVRAGRTASATWPRNWAMPSRSGATSPIPARSRPPCARQRTRSAGSTCDFRAILDLNLVAPLITMRAMIQAGLNHLSAVARKDLESARIAVSTLYPFSTATEFLDSVRAGHEAAAELEHSHGPQPHLPERVAEAVLDLITSGAERAGLVLERFGGSFKG